MVSQDNTYFHSSVPPPLRLEVLSIITHMSTTTVYNIKRIGILGGSSDQATADYYRQLNKAVNDRLGGLNTAELLISSMNFALAADCARNGKWEEVGTYLASRAVALEKGGADVIICVSNTLHRVSDRVAAAVSIPFLHIADPTAKAIASRGFKRVILLGTKPTMTSDYLKNIYTSRYGVEVVFPTMEEIDEIDRIIFDELCRGVFLPKSKATYLRVIDRMRKEENVEGVVLGCTEIPLLISQADRVDFPFFDTTALHVQAVVDFALQDVNKP